MLFLPDSERDFFAVYRGLPQMRQRGRAVNIMLTLPFVYFTGIGVALLPISIVESIVHFILAAVSVVPAFILSKAGYVRVAVALFSCTYGFINLYSLIGSASSGLRGEFLLGAMYSFLVCHLVSAALLSERIATATLLYCVFLVAVLYAVWVNAHGLVGDDLDLLLYLIYPAAAQIVFGAASLYYIRADKAHRRRQEALGRLLHAVLNTVPGALAVFNASGQSPIFRSPHFERLLGPLNAAPGSIYRTRRDLAEPLLGQEAPQEPSPELPWQLVARTGIPYTPPGYVTLSRGGLEIHLEEQAVPVTLGSDEYIIYTAVDVTEHRVLVEKLDRLVSEQKQVAIQLQDTSRARSELLANVSHEMRTPLLSIVIRLQAMRVRHTAFDDSVLKDLQVLENAANDALSQVDNLLVAARLTTKNLRLQMTPLKLKSVIDDVLTTVAPLIAKKKLDLQRVVAIEEITVYADEKRIRQIAYNLLDNAIKYTAHGTLTVQIKRNPPFAEVSISDTGSGIAPDKLENIFDRFARAVEVGDVQQDGLGLGLSIARGLVIMHDGQLWVESEVGRGSTFTFTLPLLEDD